MNRPYGLAVDVWAFGCCLVCLMADSWTPYPNLSLGVSPNFVASIISGALQPQLPPSSPLYGYVRDCCNHSAAHRVSAEEIAKQLMAVHARGKASSGMRDTPERIDTCGVDQGSSSMTT